MPIGPGGFQQAVGADDIGLDKIRRTVNRAVDMDSAARCMIAWGSKRAITALTVAWSMISAWTNSYRLLVAMLASDSKLPA